MVDDVLSDDECDRKQKLKDVKEESEEEVDQIFSGGDKKQQ
jgi:hypothetical protein